MQRWPHGGFGGNAGTPWGNKKLAAVKVTMKIFKYTLPVDKAIAKVEEHCKAVEAKLPKKPLHRIPYWQLYNTVARVLSRHPDWAFEQPKNKADLAPKARGTPLYANYEIGHTFIVKRVTSQLIAERLLPKEHEDLFKESLGKLHTAAPLKFYQRMLSAFNRLVKQLGEEKADKLIRRADEMWKKYDKEEIKYVRRPPSQKNPKIPTESIRALGDMFANPKWHLVFSFDHFRTLMKTNTAIEAYRGGLLASIEFRKKEAIEKAVRRTGKPPRRITIHAYYRMK